MHICLFDIDGTLLNTGGAGQAAMEAALASEFDANRPIEGISTAGRTDRAITADMFEYFGYENNEQNWQRFLSSYLKHLPGHLATCEGAVLPGIPQLLAELSARDDVLLGLLTGNYEQGAWLKLDYYQLSKHFGFGGFGDIQHHRNDVAREAFDKVSDHHDEPIDRNKLWVIGDTPADVECGRAIGAKTIAVSTGMFSSDELQSSNPDHLFADFGKTSTLLELLM